MASLLFCGEFVQARQLRVEKKLPGLTGREMLELSATLASQQQFVPGEGLFRQTFEASLMMGEMPEGTVVQQFCKAEHVVKLIKEFRTQRNRDLFTFLPLLRKLDCKPIQEETEAERWLVGADKAVSIASTAGTIAICDGKETAVFDVLALWEKPDFVRALDGLLENPLVAKLGAGEFRPLSAKGVARTIKGYVDVTLGDRFRKEMVENISALYLGTASPSMSNDRYIPSFCIGKQLVGSSGAHHIRAVQD